MRPIPILFALLALAACDRRPIPVPLAQLPMTPAQRECVPVAQRSEEVAAVWRRVSPQWNPRQDGRFQDDLRDAETRAWRACLAERGLARPGGVQAIRPE